MTLNINNLSQEDFDKARNAYENAATDLAFPFYRFLSKLESIEKENQSNVDYEFIQKKINSFKKFIDSFSTNISSFYMDNPEYIVFWIKDSTILEELEELEALLISLEPKESINYELDLDKVINKFNDVFQVYLTAKRIAERESKANRLISELEEQVEKATNSVKSVISAKEALESKPTEDIYSNAAKKYIKTARFYDVLLLILLGAFYYLTSQFFQNFQMIAIFKAIQKSSSEAQTLAIFFFITKLTIVSIVITLATIFIRRSSHFRKLHDQANQTSLELNALPNYLRQVDSEFHSEIYKDLIPKFFGKEFDQSQNDKIGDLMQDQLSAGTELIKASAELVKSVKPSALADNPSDRSNN